MSLTTPDKIRTFQRKLYCKAKSELAFPLLRARRQDLSRGHLRESPWKGSYFVGHCAVEGTVFSQYIYSNSLKNCKRSCGKYCGFTFWKSWGRHATWESFCGRKLPSWSRVERGFLPATRDTRARPPVQIWPSARRLGSSSAASIRLSTRLDGSCVVIAQYFRPSLG
jgi:hypothetical protein